MKTFLSQVPTFLFFTGKGGVGKTSMSSAAAVGLADDQFVVLDTAPTGHTLLLLNAILREIQ